jgi:hypothetical protein
MRRKVVNHRSTLKSRRLYLFRAFSLDTSVQAVYHSDLLGNSRFFAMEIWARRNRDRKAVVFQRCGVRRPRTYRG